MCVQIFPLQKKISVQKLDYVVLKQTSFKVLLVDTYKSTMSVNKNVSDKLPFSSIPFIYHSSMEKYNAYNDLI